MSDTHEDAVRTRFRETAAGVAEHSARQVDRVREELREFLPLTGEERALDSGTGAGVLALALAPLVREVVGVDLVPELLAAARAAAPANVTFAEGDATALPFEDASFDLAGRADLRRRPDRASRPARRARARSLRAGARPVARTDAPGHRPAPPLRGERPRRRGHPLPDPPARARLLPRPRRLPRGGGGAGARAEPRRAGGVR